MLLHSVGLLQSKPRIVQDCNRGSKFVELIFLVVSEMYRKLQRCVKRLLALAMRAHEAKQLEFFLGALAHKHPVGSNREGSRG